MPACGSGHINLGDYVRAIDGKDVGGMSKSALDALLTQVLQITATHCNTLQCTATYCNTPNELHRFWGNE